MGLLCWLSVAASPAEWLDAYRRYDAEFRGGQGHSSATASGSLAWGEARFLRDYVHCYRACGDTYWLDKILDHVDRMLASQRPSSVPGFLAWSDVEYSVAIITARGAGGLRGEPEQRRLDFRRGGRDVASGRLRVVVAEGELARLVGPAGEALAQAAYRDGLVVDPLQRRFHADEAAARAAEAPAPIVLRGQPAPGEALELTLRAPEPIEFVVHDGMVTYPIAQFIELVLADPALARWRPAAERYLAWFDRHVFERWEGHWVQVDAETGCYRFSDNGTERYPGARLPHNQYLALGRAYLVLQAVEAAPRREAYRAKAVAMAKLFRRALRERDGAYVWNYWDVPERPDIRAYVEDFSHGAIDVGFVCEAAARGIEYGPADLTKLARTYTDVMFNGNAAAPACSQRVDGSGATNQPAWFDWHQLARHDARAREVVLAIARAANSPSAGPAIAVVLAGK